MSRVLRQIFKKIFCGDLFRPAAIFFCAPAAALSPSRTVCASSFPYRLPVPSSCPFPPFCTPLRVLFFPVPFVSFCGQVLCKRPFFPSRASALSLAMHAHDPHAFFLSHALFYIVACAHVLCIFLLLREHIPRTLIFCCQTSRRR